MGLDEHLEMTSGTSSMRSPRNANCILVLKGLDEFPNGNNARSRFLEDCKRVLASTQVKVLITSRDEVDIRAELSALTTQPSKLTYHA